MNGKVCIIALSPNAIILKKLHNMLSERAYLITACNTNCMPFNSFSPDPPADIIIADIRAKDNFTIDILNKFHRNWPLVSQIALVNSGDVDTIVKLSSVGNISRFIPFDLLDELIFSVLEDIISIQSKLTTDLKEKKDQLQLIYKYHLLFDSLPTGFISIDEKGLIIKMNSTSCNLLDIRFPLVGRHVDSLPDELIQSFENACKDDADVKLVIERRSRKIAMVTRKLNDFIFSGVLISLSEIPHL